MTELAPPDRWGDHDRALASASPRTRPRFAGVRPVRAGRPDPPDPRPRVSARLGAPLRQALRAVARPRGADRPRRPGRGRPGVGARPRPTTRSRRCTSIAGVDRAAARAPAASRSGSWPAGYTGAETRIASVPDLVRAGPGGAGARPARAALGATPRCRSSGCSASRRDRRARDPRSSCSRPATRGRSRSSRSGGSSARGAQVVVVACGPQADQGRRPGAAGRVHRPTRGPGRPVADGRAAGDRPCDRVAPRRPGGLAAGRVPYVPLRSR